MTESPRPWWQDAVVYQVYPRSFHDANGDGIGDLAGIIEKLDYLNGTDDSLGVDAIWLSPVYPSPMHDFGYDISDYRGISPEFGDLDTFKTLLIEAHRRGIRVLMDLVMNHCSSQHPWFVEARSSRDSRKRDWFIWHDGVGDKKKPPNNWQAAFGGGAWQWDESGQYYLHSFLPEQPDLNWRNPELAAAMFDMMRYWLDLGVDGFRLDVANWFIKDDALRDNPLVRVGRPYDAQAHLYDRNRPEAIGIMRDVRRVVDEYPGRMTVGEIYVEAPGDPALPAEYYAGGEGLHLAFNFAFLYTKWKAEHFARAIDRWESLLWPSLWPNYTLSNHDQPRAFSRYARGGNAEARARVAAVMLLTLRGTPFLYYGEELGMSNGKIARADLRDPVGKRYWPIPVSRDRARTPMQWTAGENAGFSRGKPWLPVADGYRHANVARQENDPRSLLSLYRSLIRLRKTTTALRTGSYRRLVQTDRNLLTYVREHDGERVLVVLNFGARIASVRLPAGLTWDIVLSASGERRQGLTGVQPVPGDGAWILAAR